MNNCNKWMAKNTSHFRQRVSLVSEYCEFINYDMSLFFKKTSIHNFIEQHRFKKKSLLVSHFNEITTTIHNDQFEEVNHATVKVDLKRYSIFSDLLPAQSSRSNPIKAKKMVTPSHIEILVNLHNKSSHSPIICALLLQVTLECRFDEINTISKGLCKLEARKCKDCFQNEFCKFPTDDCLPFVYINESKTGQLAKPFLPYFSQCFRSIQGHTFTSQNYAKFIKSDVDKDLTPHCFRNALCNFVNSDRGNRTWKSKSTMAKHYLKKTTVLFDLHHLLVDLEFKF